MTTSMSGSETISAASAQTRAWSPTISRARSTSRSATRVIAMLRPARRVISSRLRASTSKVPRPIVPIPNRPTRTGPNFSKILSRWPAPQARAGSSERSGRPRPDEAVAAEGLANAPQGLPDPLLVLDQREAHMGVAVVAEADAGRNGDLGLVQQLLRELERSHGLVGIGDLGPDVHRGPGQVHLPADVGQAAIEHVAPLLVLDPDLLDAVLRAFQGRDGRHLHRREHAVVVVALDARERVDELAVADHEADAPARHVVALAHGEELDRDVARAGHLHDRRRLVAVEDDVGIGEVVHHQDVVRTRE